MPPFHCDRHKTQGSAEAGRLARFYLALQGCQLGRFKAGLGAQPPSGKIYQHVPVRFPEKKKYCKHAPTFFFFGYCGSCWWDLAWKSTLKLGAVGEQFVPRS